MAKKFRKIPAHIQLSQTLRKLVVSEGMSRGDRFLTTREISKEYSVSLVTAHKSVRQLVDDNILKAHPSKGCFVAGGINNIHDTEARSCITILEQYTTSVEENSIFFAHALDNFLKGVQHSIPAIQVQVERYPSENAIQYVKSLVQKNDELDAERIYILSCVDVATQRFFAESGLRAITIGHIEEGIELPSVQRNEYDNASLAITLLLNKGYKRVFLLQDMGRRANRTEYRKAFVDSLKRSNPQLTDVEIDRFIVEVPLMEGPGLAQIQGILAGNRGRIAILTSTDSLGAWCIRAASNLGWKIPDELGLASLQGTCLAELLTPKLSSVANKEFEIGIAVGRYIRLRDDDEKDHGLQHKIAYSLVERETT